MSKIKTFDFLYDWSAIVCFKVDTEEFTECMARASLEFYGWEYNKENNPIEEVMKKYAMTAIKIATYNRYNTEEVKEAFEAEEGLCKVDGSIGIELVEVVGYEFNERYLEVEIS